MHMKILVVSSTYDFSIRFFDLDECVSVEP